MTITVDTFKNPINTGEKTGFKIEVRDNNGFLVDESADDLAIDSMSTVATFSTLTLSLDSSIANSVGQETIVSITGVLGFPIE